jgi:SH3 domain protein
MLRKTILAAALIAAPVTWAQDNLRYIVGERTLAVREEPSSNAELVTFVETGDAMQLLESMGENSYARVRLPDGREGWLAARFLTDEKPAAERLRATQQELEAERERVAQLEKQVAQLQARLEDAAPALELADRNAELEAELKAQREELEQSLAAYDAERARQRTLVIGAALVGGGVLLGLLLPVLARRRRSSYGDL